MVCKGRCEPFRFNGFKYKYVNGGKRCMICNIMLKVEGWFCPCCGMRLRGSPRHTKLRNIYKEKMGIKAI